MSENAKMALVVVVVVLAFIAYDFARYEAASTNAHVRPAGFYFPGAGVLGPAPETRW